MIKRQQISMSIFFLKIKPFMFFKINEQTFSSHFHSTYDLEIPTLKRPLPEITKFHKLQQKTDLHKKESNQFSAPLL